MATSDLITQKEAAAILNRSVSAVSRAIKGGRLGYADSERRLLARPGLEQRFARKTRPRIDAPQRKAQNAPMRDRDERLSDWTEQANAYLDATAWSAPPWTRDQWITLRNVIELAEDC